MAKVSASTTYYTSHAIARLVRVSPSTVLSWIDKGMLPAHRTPGGHRRVEASTLLRFLRENGMPVPRELLSVATLLIVDDDVTFLRAMERLLRQHVPDLRIETADSAVDGLLKVGTTRPDAVLLDAYMPGMNGVEVCRRLSGSPETRHILVLACTGQPSAEIVRDFRDAGAAECFTKPVDLPGLLRALGLTSSLPPS